ncbi:MAG TPA: cyanophycin synthetase [Blastocatellia bacterium]|nr:cyanophycin synthetase [Blastocatellia bacterium]
MNYNEATDYLYSLGHEVLTAKFELESERLLLEELGNPQKRFKSVIVAGTNGKGSTAAMLDAVARAAGCKTALYTSPHLVRLEERIKFAAAEISEADFARHASLVRGASEKLVANGGLAATPTFFEQVTAIAFSFFGERCPDLAVLEVGLGGRLDATNLANPDVAVITAIGYDHQNILGNEIDQIAAEKAAVIRPGMNAVVSRQPYQLAGDVIMQRCIDAAVLPVFTGEVEVEETTSDGRLTVLYSANNGVSIRAKLGLRGRHQAENAAAVVEAACLLKETGLDIGERAIVDGLEQVEWPGRLETFDSRPALLMDGAHNIDGARALRQYLDEFWHGPLTLVFGAMSDKNLEGMAGELFGAAKTLVLTRARDRRAATGAEIGKYAIDGWHNVIFTESSRQALSWARSLTPAGGLICVAGSLHLVGEVKRLLEQEDDQRTLLRPDGVI